MVIKNEGDKLMGAIMVPLFYQDVIFADVLKFIPGAYKQIGISFQTYWDYRASTRRVFLGNAVGVGIYPTLEQLKTILLKENKKAIGRLISHSSLSVGPYSKSELKWKRLIRSTFKSMSYKQINQVWKRINYYRMYLIDWLPKTFLPLILSEKGISNTERDAISIRLKK